MSSFWSPSTGLQEADAAERTNTRNGYRHREFATRAGTLDVAIPEPMMLRM